MNTAIIKIKIVCKDVLEQDKIVKECIEAGWLNYTIINENGRPVLDGYIKNEEEAKKIFPIIRKYAKEYL
ncbi:MAG: hypothetical protein WC788_06080 [Candidatus Paceibacterota bacterium]|jgi:hypothetical protein